MKLIFIELRSFARYSLMALFMRTCFRYRPRSSFFIEIVLFGGNVKSVIACKGGFGHACFFRIFSSMRPELSEMMSLSIRYSE